MQFQFTSFTRLEQTNEQGVINYLSSELFPGIGLLTAKSLVEALGVKAVEKIQEDETVLDSLKLSKAQKKSLIEGIRNNANTQAMMLFLMNNGITIDMAHKIIATLGSDALEKIKAMPYCLMQAVPRFGFKKNDAFALRIGVENRTGSHQSGYPVCFKRLDFQFGQQLHRNAGTFPTGQQVFER